MIKSISYAYATSPMAVRLKRKAQGCYYVQLNDCETCPIERVIYGPFETWEAAKQKADALPMRYGRYSMAA